MRPMCACGGVRHEGAMSESAERGEREHVDTETRHSRKADWDVSVTSRTATLVVLHRCSLRKVVTLRASRPALQRPSFRVNPPPSPAPPHSCLCVCCLVRLRGSSSLSAAPAGVDETQRFSLILTAPEPGKIDRKLRVALTRTSTTSKDTKVLGWAAPSCHPLGYTCHEIGN